MALAGVRRMASHINPALNTIGAAIARFCSRYKIVVSDLTYIPSETNPMDVHSRQWSLDRVAMEWPLRLDTFTSLTQFFHIQPVVDAFATASNTKLPRFWSRFLDPHAEAVNAFDRSWAPQAVGGWLYVNPPFSLRPRVISKIICDRARALLVVPEWFSTVWWADMTSMIAHPIFVRLHSSLAMEQSVSDPRWNLRAVLVDGALCNSRSSSLSY